MPWSGHGFFFHIFFDVREDTADPRGQKAMDPEVSTVADVDEQVISILVGEVAMVH